MFSSKTTEPVVTVGIRTGKSVSITKDADNGGCVDSKGINHDDYFRFQDKVKNGSQGVNEDSREGAVGKGRGQHTVLASKGG